MKAFINATVYDFENFYTNAYVLFDKTVIEVGSMEDFNHAECEIIDATNHLVMPNLIVGHTHVYSTFARGMKVAFNPKNFQDILDQLWWKLDRHLNNEMIYYSGIVSAVDFLKNGVTTLIDHHASGIDIEGSLDALKSAICDEVSLRGSFAFETSDRFDTELALRENRTFIANNQNEKTRGMFGFHASMSLSEDTLKEASKVLNNQPIHIHVAESEMDQDDALSKYNERVVERLNRHRLLTKNSILTHAIHVDENELQLIKDNACVVAVNITSNMNNGVGLPDVLAFIDKEIPVIIGNDGISTAMTSEYLALYYAMHHHYKSATAFGLDALLKIIRTTYAYASTHFNIKIGKIAEGYVADMMLVPYIPPTPLTEENIFGHLFFGLFHSFKPRHVFVAGKQLVDDYAIDENLQLHYQKARQFAKRLWENIEKEGNA